MRPKSREAFEAWLEEAEDKEAARKKTRLVTGCVVTFSRMPSDGGKPLTKDELRKELDKLGRVKRLHLSFDDGEESDE